MSTEEEKLAVEAAQDAVDEEEKEQAEDDAAGETPKNAEDSTPANSESSPRKEEQVSAPKGGLRCRPFMPHDKMPALTTARKLEYCPECGMPPDFCDFGGKWEICKPWVLANYPEFYPQLAGLSIDDMRKTAATAKAEADKKLKEKPLPGGKVKKEKEVKLQVKVERRQGRKKTTTIVGMDAYGVKLEAAAKIFKKKFACGSAAVKGNPGQPDCVEIQGDPGQEELCALLKKEFPELPVDTLEWREGS